MSKELLLVVEAVANEKNVDRGVIFDAMEQALAMATKKRHGVEMDVRVELNRKTGEYLSYRRWFVLADDEGHEIDVHVVVLDDKGNGIYGPAENGEMYPAEGLTGSGTIDGQVVKCISPEVMVKFHSGYELKDKDFQDVRAICDKFGIELPEEYAHNKN